MNVKIFQKGFNYSQDGQGNRLILHLQGCNMKCPWCSNPEGVSVKGTIVTEKEWLRDSLCPKGAVKEKTLDRSYCDSCEEKLCLQIKRQKGIRLSFKEYEIDEIVKECVAAKPMFFDGGGVTLTGGEITMQYDAVKELLKKLGDAGIHRAIESNGTHPKMAELVPLVEQWIMDVKHYDNEIHKKWLGVPNTCITKTLKEVSKVHRNMLVRVPLIPGFNDSEADAVAFAKYFVNHMDVEKTKVEFLAYHEFGKGKWEQCGMEYQMPPVRLKEGTVAYFENIMKQHGIICVRT